VSKEKQVLILQEPTYVEEGSETDFFDTHNTIDEIVKILKTKDIKDGVQIIGLFDAFGEGKSTLVKTMQKKYDEEFCFIELDLWKYENSELQHDFHKVFRTEKGNYYDVGGMLSKTFGAGNKFRASKGVTDILATKRMLEHQYTENYFSYSLRDKVRIKKNKECQQGKIPVVVIENMDRLSTEEKSTALSSIYNYRDYFESHIIIALDPDSVRESSDYFENLVDKCFTAYMYLSPKTKYTLKRYICHHLPKVSSSNKELHSKLAEMVLTQYPLSLREVNHCINTFIMSYRTDEEYSLRMFMSILQVQYSKLYKGISQNPYILEKFISFTHDSEFNGYVEYDIKSEQVYKLNLLIKNLDNVSFKCHETLSILTPLNKQFFKERDSFDLNQSVTYIELLRKASLNKQVIEELEKLTTNWKHNDEELESFLTEIIKDRDTFINFFQSSNYEEIFNIIQRARTEGNKSIFFKMMLSYSIESIDDYTFYENYVKTVMLFKDLLVEENYRDSLILRMLENYQLTRTLLEKRIVIELDEFFLTRLKRLPFIKKILYTIEVFKILNEDSTTLRTLQNIIVKSIRDIDVEKFNDIERYKQKNIENFYFDEVPRNNDVFVTGGLILDIIESDLFERLNSSKKVDFYGKVFDNSKLSNDEYLDSIIQKFSILLNESFLIDDVIIIIEIIEKIQIIDLLGDINELVLKKFICDSLDKFGGYDDDLRDRLEWFNGSCGSN